MSLQKSYQFPVVSPQLPLRRSKPRQVHWLEGIVALVGVVNLGLVAFDWSYIPWRDAYLRQLPAFTVWYGERFKGIEPHRTTAAYLDTVDRLERQVPISGLNSPEVQSLLTQLRQQSTDLIDEDPFQIANKSGTLERIKNRMRDRLGVESSKQAFDQFWRQDYLETVSWNSAIAFFNRDLRPLIATNYYRNISETGRPVDLFWQLDIWFVAIFAADFLGRTFTISRRHPGANWLDAMVWRWYDLLFFLPIWRWVRVVPVTIRLNRSNLINLESIRTRVSHGLISSVAIELTEVVILRVIDQVQRLVQDGNVARWLLSSSSQRRYIDLNGVDEVEALTKQVLNILVGRVLPRVRPDIEALLLHSVEQALKQSSLYRGLQRFPGFDRLQLTEQIVSGVTQNVYGALNSSFADPVADELTQRLVKNLVTTLQTEIRQENTVEELEALVVALLDEIKINYVKRLSEEDIEYLREQTQRIYEITQRNSSAN